MDSAIPFVFGIPLMPRATARDWRLVECLLGLTLRTVQAQTDPEFRVIIAGHDRPRSMPQDRRFVFLEGDWPVEPPESRNCDSGRKKHALKEAVLEQGGGLLMYLDADDWVDARLVDAARASIRPDYIGGIVGSGFAVDFRNVCAAPLPHPRIFAGGFHRLCGSSVVARLRPDQSDPFRRDPWSMVQSHHEWAEAARDHGAATVRLPVSGGYLVNTSENHSELHGPFADWRQDFRKAVRREGQPLTPAMTQRFGLPLAEVRRASERFGGKCPAPQRAPEWALARGLAG